MSTLTPEQAAKVRQLLDQSDREDARAAAEERALRRRKPWLLLGDAAFWLASIADGLFRPPAAIGQADYEKKRQQSMERLRESLQKNKAPPRKDK